jgi:hypothetical protein
MQAVAVVQDMQVQQVVQVARQLAVTAVMTVPLTQQQAQ